MNVTLVTCLRIEANGAFKPEPYVPSGLLVVGAALEEVGCRVKIIDQSIAIREGLVTPGGDFYDQLAGLIRSTEPDLVGFGTMCNSYPQTIVLARHYRELDPGRPIILGGPQASVVDVETLQAFPWIDLIVRGEAEETIKALITRWRRGESLAGLPGITWRENGRVYRNPDASPIEDLDAQPMPAYHLYPLDKLTRISIEAGRGCPFQCTFCSTSRYFKRRYRVKSAARLLAEMKYLGSRYGCWKFDLHHDLFTVNRHHVRAFCQAVVESGLPIEWTCSARADCVDEELLDEMKTAGCTHIFFGIETGSARMQKVINKNLDLEHVKTVLQAVLKRGIGITCSFIIGFPQETEEDLDATFNLALDLAGVESVKVQMHLLAPLVSSSLYETHRHRLGYDGHFSDASDYLLSDEERNLVYAYPEIFASFYYMETPYLNRDKIKAIAASMKDFPTILLALKQSQGDLNTILESWLVWKEQHVNDEAMDYYRCQFGMDFFQYLRQEIAAGKIQMACLPDLVEYEALKLSMLRNRIAKSVVLHSFRHDVKEAGRRLRTGESLYDLLPYPTHLLFTQSGDEVKVIRVTPAMQRLFGLQVPA